MKTFEDECKDLAEWFKRAMEEADEIVKKLPPLRGYDDRAQYIINPVWHERNRRLVQLKIKYNIELSDNEKKLIRRPNEP